MTTLMPGNARPRSQAFISPPDVMRELTGRSVAGRRLTVGAEAELSDLGLTPSRAYILCAGWAIAHRTLQSGARQVISVYVAGDVLGAPSFCAVDRSKAGQFVSTITTAEILEFNLEPSSEVRQSLPDLSRAVMANQARTSAILHERIVSLGRRSARERTAHFFLELSVRLSGGRAGDLNRFACPLSQYVVSDALGLSAEHLNRVLKQLRLCNLLRIRSGWAEILDRQALVRIADFDPAYLLQS